MSKNLKDLFRPPARLTGMALGAALLSAVWAGSANANLLIEEGNLAGGTENILFNDSGLILQGTTVTGSTNQTGLIVEFTGNEELVIEGGGQDRIVSDDGDGFDTVTINLEDPLFGFSKLIFAVDWLVDGTTTGNVTGGQATITATDQFGTVFTETFAVDTTGQQFYTIYSNDNQVAVSATINANEFIKMTAVDQLQEVRIAPTGLTTVPEPGMLALLGSGFLGLGAVMRRRKAAPKDEPALLGLATA